MMATGLGVGFVELILISLMGLPLPQLVGLPPGDRDANLARMASGESFMYLEWASRGEGKPGAPGIDGMAAEPEVINFISKIQTAIQNSLVNESGIADLKMLPQLAVALSGHAGCLYLELDINDEFQPGPAEMALMQTLRAALVINTKGETDEIEGKITKLASLAFRTEIANLDHLAVPAPIPVQIHRHQDYLIVGLGAEVVDQIVGRLDAGNAGLAQQETFKKASADVTVQRLGSIAFIDAKKMLSGVKKIIGSPPEFATATEFTGMDKLEWAMMVTGANESGQIVSRGKLMGMKGDKGLLAGIANAKINTTDLAIVPSDSDLVLGASLDALAIKDAIISLIPPQFQDEAQRDFDQGARKLGLDWETDIFDAFGNSYVISNSPGDGGWVMSAPVISVAIKDKKAAKLSLQKFARGLNRNLPQLDDNGWRRRGVTLEQQEYKNTLIYMINTVGDDVPMAPSWCMTETHLMFTLHPQTLKSRLHRMGSDQWKALEPEFDDAPAGDMVVFSKTKSASIMRQVYGIGPWIGQLIYSQLQSEGIDLTLMDFPSAASVLPYMSDTRSYVVNTTDGIEFFAEGPPIVSSLPAMVPTVVPLMLFGRAQQARVMMDAEIAIEADAEFEAIEADAIEADAIEVEAVEAAEDAAAELVPAE